MKSGAVPAGDVPAAPAIRERGAEIDHFGSMAQKRLALFVGKDGANEDSRYAADEIPAVAAQANRFADKTGASICSSGRRIDGVENRAENRVNRRHFNQTAGHPSDIA